MCMCQITQINYIWLYIMHQLHPSVCCANKIKLQLISLWWIRPLSACWCQTEAQQQQEEGRSAVFHHTWSGNHRPSHRHVLTPLSPPHTYKYIYVCVYVCIHKRTCTHICMYIYLYTRTLNKPRQEWKREKNVPHFYNRPLLASPFCKTSQSSPEKHQPGRVTPYINAETRQTKQSLWKSGCKL